jgi:uncharacterized protein YndB with AHSA1/START domain
MSTKNQLVITTPSDREILLTREFDAPRALVWEMFTKPEHIRRWWGCHAMEVVVCEVDLRPGGEYRYVGRMPDGTECPFRGVHHEILPPEKLVFTEIFDVPVAREHPAHVTTTFTELDGKTQMRCLIVHDSQQSRDMHMSSGMESGASAGYDMIEEMAQRLSRLTLTRELAAPRSLVWRAWTEPEQFARWFGPRGFTIPRIEFDVRPGGAIRCDMRAPDGTTFTNIGSFTEIVEPERLVVLLRYEENGEIVFENLNTITFTERDNKTLVTLDVRVVRASASAPKYLMGMDEGWRQTLDRLNDLVTR